MRIWRARIITAAAAIAAVCAGPHFGKPQVVHAQNRADGTQGGAAALSAQELRGHNFFLQRCSLCHLPRKLKFGSPAVIGPSLAGQFKDATPEQMKTLRNFILKGGPDMPGFQYGLEPGEVDDLIAYLKTI